MASTIYSYNLTGGRVFPVAFEYLARRFVQVTLVGSSRRELQLNVDYRFISKTEIETTIAWTQGEFQKLDIRRVTSSTDRLVNFTDGSILRSQDLNISQIQAIHIAEEGRDVAENSMISGGLFWDALGLPIKNVGYPALPTDAANGQYVLDNIRTALRVTPSETISEIPSDRANKVLAFDSNRQPVAIIPSAGSSMELEIALADSSGPTKGAGKVGLYDPLSPAYLKVTSDILNFEPVSVLRNIPKTEWPKIAARTSDYLTHNSINQLLAAMRDAGRGKMTLPRGLFLVGGRIGMDYTSPAEIEFIGEKGTEILNMAYTPTLVFQGNASTFIKAKISQVDVTMNNPDGFTGVMGPKSVFIRYSKDSEISHVIEKGAIGFGISMQNSIDPLVAHCIARDHKGGMRGAVGTDGIHLTACTRPVVMYSYGENLADDCVSLGSFDPDWPTTDITVVGCGGRSSMGSAVKLYRMVDGASITDCWADATNVGGVALYDDRSDTKSTYDRYIRNVTITNLRARNIQNQVGAYSRAAFNIYAQNGIQKSEFSDIRFLRSSAKDCVSGAVTKIDAAATVRNLEISGFRFKDQPIVSGLNPCIFVQGVQGELKLHDNHGENLSQGLITLDNQPAAFSNPFTDSHVSIKGNSVRNYGLSSPTIAGTQHAAVFVRPSDRSMVVTMSGNEAYGQNLQHTGSGRMPFQFGGDVSPLSLIDLRSNVTDTKTKISITTGGAGVDGLVQNAAPTTGTWLTGFCVFNSLFTGAPASIRKWEFAASGTFGTLSGVTASGASGSSKVSVSNAGALYAGMFITIGTEKFRITKVVDTEVSLDSRLAAIASNAVVQFTAPVMVAVST